MAGLVRLLAVTLALLIGSGVARAQDAVTKVALVIANGAYQTVPTLDNPGRDATVIERALQRAGFTVRRVNDANLLTFGAALRDFKRAAETADVALLYFAGHGVELEGTNFLIPVDAKLEDPVDAQTEAISLDQMLRYAAPARRLRIVVLDACRDNPFKFRVATRTMSRGLKPVENLPAGTVVAYSAAAGQKALDGAAGDASPFAKAFAQRVTEPGLEVSFIFRNVYQDVVAASARLNPGKSPQEPWYDSKLGAEEIYFVAPTAPSATTMSLTVLGQNVRVSDLAAEVEAFDAASKTFTVVAWRDFLQRFPNGRMRASAQQILTSLERGPQVVAPGADPLAAARAALAAITQQEWSAAEAEILIPRVVAASSRDALEKLAASGNARAQVLVGRAKAFGISGFSANPAEYARLVRLASNAGDPMGQAYFGTIYKDGCCGVQQNHAEALRLFRLAAAQGNALGQACLGVLFYNGEAGLAQDNAEAVRLYRLAAAQGNAQGQANLGFMYYVGQGGLTQDKAEAVRLYRLAAAQGNAHGQASLGVMYYNGEGGLTLDRAEAVRLFRLAAKQGSPFAQDQLKRLGETW